MNNNLEIVVISEVNSDDTFPDSQFLIEGFPVPYKPDLTVKGGGILLYISEDLPWIMSRIKKSLFASHLKGFL